MAKVSYANLKLKTDTSVSTFKVGDTEIEVLNYLPIEDKYDLVNITLQNSAEDGIYNPVKIDMYFHLYMFYMYTNVNFTEKQKEDEFKIYNTLVSTGVMDEFLKTIPDKEYDELITYLETLTESRNAVNLSTSALIQSMIEDLPANAEMAAKVIKEFDPEKYQAVINFATAANGGRPII